jgi:hypothetical protein
MIPLNVDLPIQILIPYILLQKCEEQTLVRYSELNRLWIFATLKRMNSLKWELHLLQVQQRPH